MGGHSLGTWIDLGMELEQDPGRGQSEVKGGAMVRLQAGLWRKLVKLIWKLQWCEFKCKAHLYLTWHEYVSFFVLFSPSWSPSYSHQPASSHLSRTATTLEGWRPTLAFYKTEYFWISALQGGVTHSEESAFHPLLHTQAHRCPRLANVLLPPTRHSTFSSLGSFLTDSCGTVRKLVIFQKQG